MPRATLVRPAVRHEYRWKRRDNQNTTVVTAEEYALTKFAIAHIVALGRRITPSLEYQLEMCGLDKPIPRGNRPKDLVRATLESIKGGEKVLDAWSEGLELAV